MERLAIPATTDCLSAKMLAPFAERINSQNWVGFYLSGLKMPFK
jgi:putative methionine-R-sulfoxide reductase with GAF domain